MSNQTFAPFDLPFRRFRIPVLKEPSMMNTIRAAVRVVLIAVAISGIGTGDAMAQWDPYPMKNVPRTADNKVDLNAPARKTADGKPDLSGFWMPRDTAK